MGITLASVGTLMRLTIRDPRGGARRILHIDPPMVARWWLLALVAVVSALLTYASYALLPPEAQEILAAGMASPLRSALVQLLVLVICAVAVDRIGRWRRGAGTFPDAVLLVGWLQFMLTGVQAAQVLAQLLLPPLAEGISLFGIALFLWLFTNFVAELHGFRSLFSVFAGIIGTILAASLVLALVLVSLSPMGG